MIVTLTTRDGDVLPAEAVPGGATATVQATCPACATRPMQVHGRGMVRDPESQRDTYRATAACVCGEPAGVLRVQIETLFGIDEDERVLHGRCRVY